MSERHSGLTALNLMRVLGGNSIKISYSKSSWPSILAAADDDDGGLCPFISMAEKNFEEIN